jgi:hypothetical protein
VARKHCKHGITYLNSEDIDTKLGRNSCFRTEILSAADTQLRMLCTIISQDDMPNARQYVKQDVVTRLTAAYTNTDSEAAAAAAEQRELQELEQLHGHTGSNQTKRRARRHTHNNSSRSKAAAAASDYYSDGDYDSNTDHAAYSEAQQVERQLAQLAASQGLPDRNEDPELSRELSRSGDASFLDFLQRQQAFVQQRSEKIRCVAAADVPSFQPQICASSRRMQASHKRGSFLHRVAQNALKKDKEALRLKVCMRTHAYFYILKDS